MRDPRGPIPHPQLESHYWRTVRPPRRPSKPADRSAGSGDPREIAYDPTQLLAPADRGADLGIDRRQMPRPELEELAEELTDELANNDAAPRPRPTCVLTGAHRRFDALLGLRSAAGWALVRTISLSPNGVLLRVIDPCDPGLDGPLRLRARAALARLGPVFAEGDTARAGAGSMLATVGACLLSQRVVADVARWGQRRTTAGSPSSKSTARPHLAVELVVPPSVPPGGRRHMRVAPAPALAAAAPTRITGTVVPLNDPSDLVLAVALTPQRRAQLDDALRGARDRRSPATNVDVDAVLA